MHDDLAFYARHSAHSEPGDFAHLLDGGPTGWEPLCSVAPNVILHYFFADALEPPLPPERVDDRRARPLCKILERIAAIDPRPLSQERAPQSRFSGNCAHFALLTCGLLRQAGVPARLRAGFAGYFTPGFYEDHWLCEAWDRQEGRWRLLDAELDPVVCERFSIAIDPQDVPRDAFLTAGDAWRLWRSNPALGDRFGVSFVDINGSWFFAGSLLRDLAALNKVELQPSDYWSFSVEISDAGAIPAEREPLLEEIAAATSGPAPELDTVRALYERADLAVPDEVVGFPYGPRELCPVL